MEGEGSGDGSAGAARGNSRRVRRLIYLGLTKEMAARQHHWFSHWAYITLNKEDYKKLGEVTAWRVLLLDGEKVLSEQKSFLW